MNRHSMKTRFVLLGFCLLVGAVVFRLMVALPFAQDQLRELVSAQQLALAQYIARDVDTSLVERRALVGQLAASLPTSLLSQHDELTEWLAQRHGVNPLFDRGVFVVHADGHGLIADYPSLPRLQQLNFSDREWFRAALASDGPIINHPSIGRASGKPVVVMSCAVRDGKGKIVAVLGGVVQLSTPGFLDGLQQQKMGASGGFLLISPADKLFVGASDPGMVFKPTPAPGMNALHDRAMGGFRGTGVTVNVKGVEEVVAIASVPSTGWYVVSRIPTTEAYQPVTALRGLLLKSSVVILLIVTAIILVALPRMLRPITEAARAMRDMADGRRELEALPVTRHDELGDLVLGFNYLVTRLREKEAALRASEASMAFIAHHDSLTGLFNRTMLEDRLAQALARAERDERHFALLFCDLDFFKPINDDFGHDIGDAVLVEVAARLTHGRRRVDTVARHGGDEFVVLLTDLDDARADAETVGRQYLQALAQPFVVGERSFTLSVSIGVALYLGEPIAGSQLMSRADVAMYQAKRSGKNTMCFFGDPTTPQPVLRPSAPVNS
jgi:diguanylate cyclase (GGDEF)-like protein